MKKIKMTLEISEALAERMDQAAIDDGFNSRSEFLRFLIVTYLKKEHLKELSAGTNTRESDKEETDEFTDADLEYGIPVEVIEKIKRKAAILAENERRQLP